MDYKNLLFETLGMNEETLSVIDEIHKNFNMPEFDKWDMKSCLDNLAMNYFDIDLCSEIQRELYYKIEKKAEKELNAESDLFDWDVDGKNSKFTYSGKAVNNWDELKARVEEHKRLLQKLKCELRYKDDFKDMSNEWFESCWKELLRKKTFNEIIDIFDIQGVRVCSCCDSLMDKGYCIEAGEAYYCDDECLYSEMTEEEYDALYNCEGDGETYYTEW